MLLRNFDMVASTCRVYLVHVTLCYRVSCVYSRSCMQPWVQWVIFIWRQAVSH